MHSVSQFLSIHLSVCLCVYLSIPILSVMICSFAYFRIHFFPRIVTTALFRWMHDVVLRFVPVHLESLYTDLCLLMVVDVVAAAAVGCYATDVFRVKHSRRLTGIET